MKIRLSEEEIRQFMSSRVWLAMLQEMDAEAEAADRTAKNARVTERQASLALGYGSGIDFARKRPRRLAVLAKNNPLPETPESLAEEERLRKYYELKGEFINAPGN